MGYRGASLLDKVFCCLVCTHEIVDYHATYIKPGKRSVEQHQRDAFIVYLPEVIEIFCVLGKRNNDAVYSRIEQGLYGGDFTIVIIMRLADHHVVVGLLGNIFDATNDRPKEAPVNGGYDDSDNVAATIPQRRSDMVGLIV